MSKWLKNVENQDEADAIIEARKERNRQKQRAWAKANRDKVNAYKAATKERKRAVMSMNVNNVTTSRYHADWKKAPVYPCPELTYRGKQND